MRILAVSPQGIGNNVLFTPAVKVMSGLFPYVTIDVVSKYPSLWSGLPFINPIFKQEDIKEHYDIGLTSLFGKQEIYPGVEFEEKLRPPEISYYKQHEIALNVMPIIEKYEWSGDIPAQHVPVIPHEGFYAGDSPVIGIMDGSKPRSDCQSDGEYLVWKKKRWPHYLDLIEKLLDDDVIVVVFGTEEDGPNNLPKHDNLRDARGNFQVHELAGAMLNCNVLITNDTGPMHIADAAGMNMIALFGPTSITKNSPVGQNSIIIDAQEITGIEEPKQGTKGFAKTERSASLEALKPKVVLGAIEEYREEGELNWL